MPKRSNSFQQLITFIENEFSSESVKVTESALLKDAINDVEREVDILIQGKIGEYEISIGVECRDRKRKADLTWIDEIIGKYQHLPIDRKVAVSKSGFTRTAIEKAKKYNIETLTLEAAIETDWIESVERVVNWEMEGRKLLFHSVGLNFSDDVTIPPKEFNNSDILYGKNGNPVGKVQHLIDWIVKTPPVIEKTVQKELVNMRPGFKEGLNVFRIHISIPAKLIYESNENIRYDVSAVLVDVECRVEIVKPTIKEYKLKEKYLAVTEAIFSDAPVEVTTAAISSGKKNDEFKMFFSSNQEIIHTVNGDGNESA